MKEYYAIRIEKQFLSFISNYGHIFMVMHIVNGVVWGASHRLNRAGDQISFEKDGDLFSYLHIGDFSR